MVGKLFFNIFMKYLLTLTLFMITSFVFSQTSAVCTYKIIRNSETIKINEEDNNLQIKSKVMLNKAIEIAENFSYKLAFNKNESLYQIEEFLPIDGTNNNLSPVAKALSGKGIFYQNKEDNLVLDQSSAMGNTFLISSKLFTNWEITKETKIINGFLCYKAIRECKTCPNKETESVWFTPDIPVPFGPFGYGGLPGLIMEIKKGLLINIQLETISYSNDNICVDKPAKGKQITLNEYNKLTQEYRNKAKEY
jgi:GLPGLI family protein